MEKETNTHLEINSSHNHLNVEQLIAIKDIGNTFIIGSDAHKPTDVGRFFPAIYTMKYSGLPLSRITNVRFWIVFLWNLHKKRNQYCLYHIKKEGG